MSNPILESRIRAQNFWYRDGLSEIAVGIVIVLQSGFTLLMHFGNDHSPWYWPVILIFLHLFFVYAVRAPRVWAAMRERITHPRSGYAEPSESVRKLKIAVIAVSILSIFALLLATRSGYLHTSHWNERMPIVVGLFISVVGTYVAMHYGVLRYLLIGVFAIVFGLAIDLEYPSWLGVEMWFVGVGCAFLFAGAITAWNFVRTTPFSTDAR